MSTTLTSLLPVLQHIAPLELAADWDNVGLLIDPGAADEVERLMLTIDLTEPVLMEAIEERVTFIVAYHPVIFRGMTRITQRTSKERVVAAAIRQGVAVYSPHTALDAVPGGINDWLADGVGAGRREPIERVRGDVAERIPGAGMGRLLTLDVPVCLDVVLARIKAHLALEHVRVAVAERHRAGTPIGVAAVCAGAGGSVLAGETRGDLLLTGEMRHHDVSDAVARGQTVVLTDHTNSERGFLPLLAVGIASALRGRVGVIVSRHDADPLVVT